MKDYIQRTQDTAIPALVATGLTAAHSLHARGTRPTIVFAALSLALPAAAEYVAINVTRDLRHHTYPQVKGVPLGALAGWYAITHATFTMVESVIGRRTQSAQRRWILPVATAATATSLDLMLDCMGLDTGMWEWASGGPYAAELVGPNGQRGIPVANFTGWIVLTGAVTLLYDLFTRTKFHTTDDHDRLVRAGRSAALLASPYYLLAAAWAISQRKPRYLLYSALFPVVVVAAATRRREQDAAQRL